MGPRGGSITSATDRRLTIRGNRYDRELDRIEPEGPQLTTVLNLTMLRWSVEPGY